MRHHGFYFVGGRRGQTPADLGSGDGVSGAAGRHSGSVWRSGPLGMGAESVDDTVEDLFYLAS